MLDSITDELKNKKKKFFIIYLLDTCVDEKQYLSSYLMEYISGRTLIFASSYTKKKKKNKSFVFLSRLKSFKHMFEK
jgi:hypothetical protein